MRVIKGFFRGLGSVMKWTLIVGALLIVIIVIVAIAGIGKKANESQKSADSITAAKYQQVQNGQSEDVVKRILGKPEDMEATNVQGLGKENCWFYGTLAPKTTQICFDNGKVSYKSQVASK